jgi:hypothetical protein
MENDDLHPAHQLILSAIKEADRGLFFMADHHLQVLNIIKKLEINGYRIVPTNPAKEKIDKAAKKINIGLNDPNQLVTTIYKTIID